MATAESRTIRGTNSEQFSAPRVLQSATRRVEALSGMAPTTGDTRHPICP